MPKNTFKGVIYVVALLLTLLNFSIAILFFWLMALKIETGLDNASVIGAAFITLFFNGLLAFMLYEDNPEKKY